MKTPATSVLTVLMTLCAACAVHAETYTYVGTAANYAETKASDITNAVKWSSGAMPCAGNVYKITSDWDTKRFCGVGIDGAFPGDELWISGPQSYLVFQTPNNGTRTYEFPRTGLTLSRGEIWLMGAGATYNVAGDVTIKNTEAGYGYIRGMINERMTLVFNGKFNGAANAIFYVRQQGASDKSYDIGYKAQFRGDMSGYLGTINVGANTKEWGRAEFGDTTVGGTVKVLATGTVGPCGEGDGLGECSFVNLNLSSGSTLRCAVSSATGGTVRVTGALTLPESGTVNVNISSFGPAVNSAVRHPLLIVPSGTGLGRERFNLQLPSQFTAFCKEITTDLVVEDDGTNEVLYLVVHPYVTQVATDGDGQSVFLPENASHWNGLADGTALDPNTVYYSSSWQYHVRTPRKATTATFGGWGLVIGKEVQAYVYDSAIVDRLYIYPTAYFCHSTGVERFVDGTIYAVNPSNLSGYIYVVGRDGATFDIRSEIRGYANIRFSTQQNFFGYGNPTFVLGGTNTAYSGRFLITNEKKVEPYHTTVVIADGRSMGGAMAENTYNGVQLQNRSILRVTASTEIAEPTRGWHLLGHNTIQVANGNDEVKLSSPLTMSGELVKDGPGTLALGGCCRFTAEQSDVPIAGTNKLTVAAGRVKPLAKGAFDGLAISFAAGTGLALALPDEADEDVAAFGLVDVKWATPFDLTACGGTLSVRLDGAETVLRDDEFQLAICTVSATAADALRGHIAVARVPHHRVQVLERTNPDGSITFYADVKTSGLVLLVR